MCNAPLSEAEIYPDNRVIKNNSEPKNLVSQNQKYRLHLAPLSQSEFVLKTFTWNFKVLERAPVDKVNTKTEYNRLSIRFRKINLMILKFKICRASTNAKKLLWGKFKTRLNHKWIQDRMQLMEYFEWLLLEFHKYWSLSIAIWLLTQI